MAVIYANEAQIPGNTSYVNHGGLGLGPASARLNDL